MINGCLQLYICTNDPEVCDFMTNDIKYPYDIFKCNQCDDGFMVVKPGKNPDERFYGCTNYNKTASGCKHSIPIKMNMSNK